LAISDKWFFIFYAHMHRQTDTTKTVPASLAW